MTITRGRARQPHACIADLFPSPPPTASASRRWSPMARRELFLALLCIAASALATGADAADARKMVGVYELRKGDFSVKVTNWGARLMSVVFPDSKGALPAAVFFMRRPVAYSPVLHCWEPGPCFPFVPRIKPCMLLLLLQGIWLMSSLAETPSLNTS